MTSAEISITKALPAELETVARRARGVLDDWRSKGLRLDMTRGKPSAEQLDLASGLFAAAGGEDFRAADGTDCRNYGGLDGLPEAKALFAPMLDVPPASLVIGGNASLTLMHDVIVQALLRGVPGGSQPWSRRAVKVLCPSPGYDRHFAICERFGLEMVPVAMTEEGPDVEAVAKLAAEDDAVRAMICVPKYSNPTGVTYSNEVVRALASMRTKAPDFRLIWDNAYSLHHLTDSPDRLLPALQACDEAGQADRILLFASTSKISVAGGGVAMMAGSPANVEFLRAYRSIQTIGPDKMNQLRHVRFFGDFAGIEAHMARHAAILRPRFEAVDEVLRAELGGLAVATWSRPRGGYFISLDTQPGCARRVVALAAEAGVKLTPAGATFPLGTDPRDRNIRIAPSFPSIEELRAATAVLSSCVLLATAEQRLAALA